VVISVSNVVMTSLFMTFSLHSCSQVWYILSPVFTRDKGKLVFKLH